MLNQATLWLISLNIYIVWLYIKKYIHTISVLHNLYKDYILIYFVYFIYKYMFIIKNAKYKIFINT